MRRKIRAGSICLAAILVIGSFTGCAGKEVNLDTEIKRAVEFVHRAYPKPSVGSVGGDWAVKGIAESGVTEESLDEYYAFYVDDVRARLKRNAGVLDEEYYTTYARVAIGVEAVGLDPTNVDGYNLIQPLDDYEMITGQGVNAAAFALIASNLAGVTLENEEEYLDYMIETLEKKKLYGDAATSDYAAMAAEALCLYPDDAEAAAMLENCIQGLAEVQRSDGSFGNCESTAEAIIALTCAGIDPLEDERFIKDGNTLLDGLMLYRTKDGYVHLQDGEETDCMSAEKALLALDSLKLVKEGTSLYAAESE